MSLPSGFVLKDSHLIRGVAALVVISVLVPGIFGVGPPQYFSDDSVQLAASDSKTDVTARPTSGCVCPPRPTPPRRGRTTPTAGGPRPTPEGWRLQVNPRANPTLDTCATRAGRAPARGVAPPTGERGLLWRQVHLPSDVGANVTKAPARPDGLALASRALSLESALPAGDCLAVTERPAPAA